MKKLVLGDDPVVSFKTKLKLFLGIHWKGLVCFFVPIIFAAALLPFPPQKHQWCAYCLINMAAFWVTECIPLPVTSFLPIVVFPLVGVMDTVTTCVAYFNDTMFMFLASLILASCVEQSGLHLRIAFSAIQLVGYSHYKLLFAMSYTCMFISMWITNTAATTMMVPVCFALLKVFQSQGLLKIYDKGFDGEPQASDLTTCYFCSITYSATIGGIGTLVGTATNLVFKGLFMAEYKTAPEYLSFPLFSAFAVPFMLCLETAVYFWMLIVYFGFGTPNSAKAKAVRIPKAAMEAAKAAVKRDKANLGPMSFWEYMVCLLFGGAMICFFSRSPQIFPGWADKINEYYGVEDLKFIKDSALGMFVSFLMFMFPSTLQFFKNFRVKSKEELKNGRIRSVLDWHHCHQNLPWSFVFLLGGGFALSTAAKAEYSDLNGKMGEILVNLKALPNLAVLFLIIVFTCLINNFASNVAMCNVVCPIAMQLAAEISQNPLWYNIASGYSASFCFCLPVGTPGNLVVQSAAKIPTPKMIKAGSGPTITTIIIAWLAIAFYAPVVWPDLKIMPAWTKEGTISGAVAPVIPTV